MNRTKIKLATPETVANFINVCTKYDCDINIYDGSTVIDAKSIIGVFSIQQGKVVEVQAVTTDQTVAMSFLNDIRKYEV